MTDKELSELKARVSRAETLCSRLHSIRNDMRLVRDPQSNTAEKIKELSHHLSSVSQNEIILALLPVLEGKLKETEEAYSKV